MATVGTRVTDKVFNLLGGPSGLNASLGTLSQGGPVTLRSIGNCHILTQNVPADLVERSKENKYPMVSLYCERLANQLTEKFRTFSGKASMAVEIRVSQDRLAGLESQLQYYTEAVTQVLDQQRGDWGDGMFYAGGYEVLYTAAKHGGQNFLQVAKVMFEVGVSI